MAYRLSVPTVSPITVVYGTVDALLYGIREIVEGEDTVSLTIEVVAMTTEEVDALPEFEGY